MDVVVQQRVVIFELSFLKNERVFVWIGTEIFVNLSFNTRNSVSGLTINFLFEAILVLNDESHADKTFN